MTYNEARDRLAAIKALHTPSEGHNPECGCGIPANADRSCIECRTSWPCATIRALTPGEAEVER